MAHSAEDVQKQVRVYLSVFAALAGLTIVTVGISYMHLPVPAAVTFAMLVATLKGSLVALYFMHLIDEKRAIYSLLGLTAVFFVVVMYLPAAWVTNDMRTHPLWDKLPTEGSAPHTAGAHSGAAHEEAASNEEGGHH